MGNVVQLQPFINARRRQVTLSSVLVDPEEYLIGRLTEARRGLGELVTVGGVTGFTPASRWGVLRGPTDSISPEQQTSLRNLIRKGLVSRSHKNGIDRYELLL